MKFGIKTTNYKAIKFLQESRYSKMFVIYWTMYCELPKMMTIGININIFICFNVFI